jgi:membrane protease YdiL (CAAX protease family)
MKNYFRKRIFFLIIIIFIFLVISRKLLTLVFEESYLENIFLVQFFLKLFLLFFTIILIRRDNLINWVYINKNFFIALFFSVLLVYFSLQHTYEKLHELNITLSSFKHYSYLSQCLITGFFEEFFFRILIFSYVCKSFFLYSEHKVYKQILFTSFLFSIVHLTNLFNEDIDKLSVLNQIMFAFIIGIILQSIFYRWHNIYLNSIIHGLINYNGMRKSKLFNIENNEIEVTSFDSFTQSLITFVILGLILALPIIIFSVKKRNNNLLKK